MFKKGLLILCIVVPTLYTMKSPPAKWDDVTQLVKNQIGDTPGLKQKAQLVTHVTQKSLGAPGQTTPKLIAVLVYDPKSRAEIFENPQNESYQAFQELTE